jgi:hypothetical protein
MKRGWQLLVGVLNKEDFVQKEMCRRCGTVMARTAMSMSMISLWYYCARQIRGLSLGTFGDPSICTSE